MSAEHTLTSACTFVPNLAHSFPTLVSNKRSVQYRVALSFETTDRFSLWCSFDFKGVINTSKSSCVNSSEPSMSLLFRPPFGLILLSHIFIRLTRPEDCNITDATGIPSVTHSLGRDLLPQAQDVSNGLASLLISAGSVWK